MRRVVWPRIRSVWASRVLQSVVYVFGIVTGWRTAVLYSTDNFASTLQCLCLPGLSICVLYFYCLVNNRQGKSHLCHFFPSSTVPNSVPRPCLAPCNPREATTSTIFTVSICFASPALRPSPLHPSHTCVATQAILASPRLASTGSL